MNYRHGFHAGNFADVVKHATLARILCYLREKDAAFRVIDTHAGAGLYDLTGDEAARGGEWQAGIARLVAASVDPAAAKLLAPYTDAVAAANPSGGLQFYPGSPLIARALLRPQDRLTACELEPQAAAALTQALRRDARAKAIAIDGWMALKAYLPPPERRGVVVIDPPFEQADEFTRLGDAVAAAWRKWPTGVGLIWYPVKRASDPGGLLRRLAQAGLSGLAIDFVIDRIATDGRLVACGLAIVNPPWVLAGELAVMLPALSAALGQGQGSFRVERFGPAAAAEVR